MTNIGEPAKPPFAVLPDPSVLFLDRTTRLTALAKHHELAPYLEFLARVTEAQHSIVAELPSPSPPPAERMNQSLEHGMPPLSHALIEPDTTVLATVEQLVAHLAQSPLADAQAAIVESLRSDLASRGAELIAATLKDASPPEEVAQRVLILAGLQVHFTRLATTLNAKELKPVANGACPTCGSPPMVSSIVGWPKAYNTRYCTCSLCATMWNVIRVTCVLCGATEGVSFRVVEDQPDLVKAETCDTCRSYVKVIYQIQDQTLEPLADDVASVGLDMLLAEQGWRRGGNNPFLLGY